MVMLGMRCLIRFVVFICLLFSCMFFFISLHGPKASKGSGELHELYLRMLIAEQHERVITNKLHQLLENLYTTTAAQSLEAQQSSLNFSSALPSVLLYLPHLKEHDNSLTPDILLGQGRSGVSLVLGIPTVIRQKTSYLLNTLTSLLVDLTSEQKADIIVIVFVAETDNAFVKSVAESLQKNFPDDVKSGLIEVVCPSPYFYPNFTHLKETFGDSKERVKWRTKQNLDYSFLMLYAQNKGTYYIQLEDDIVAKTGYIESIMKYLYNEKNQQWLFLEFSSLGFIGKLFRASDLPTLVEFFLMFHKDKPIDWLLDHLLWVKVCHPEKDAKHCNNAKSQMKRTFKPSLFQHVGLHSSLSGKIQRLKDKDFERQPAFQSHLNPPAVLNTSLKHHRDHTLDRAYQGVDFFWALTPFKGDYININFTQPQTIKKYRFRTGNIQPSMDRFYNTTVEVLPYNVSVRESGQKGLLQCCKPSSDGFVVIGNFVNGMAEGQIAEELHELAAMRLIVQSTSLFWVLMREIFITV